MNGEGETETSKTGGDSAGNPGAGSNQTAATSQAMPMLQQLPQLGMPGGGFILQSPFAQQAMIPTVAGGMQGGMQSGLQLSTADLQTLQQQITMQIQQQQQLQQQQQSGGAQGGQAGTATSTPSSGGGGGDNNAATQGQTPVNLPSVLQLPTVSLPQGTSGGAGGLQTAQIPTVAGMQ